MIVTVVLSTSFVSPVSVVAITGVSVSFFMRTSSLVSTFVVVPSEPSLRTTSVFVSVVRARGTLASTFDSAASTVIGTFVFEVPSILIFVLPLSSTLGAVSVFTVRVINV